jgi:hypothetical protein
VTGKDSEFKCSIIKPEEIQQRPKHKPEIVKDVIKETGFEVVDQFCLVQDRDQ